ncbi:MAG: PTS sugar transporter subunit IIA [Actinobacteria bacterium]|nr:PTS sugar transporter subunit IIA [Actinomycetota bacterium]
MQIERDLIFLNPQVESIDMLFKLMCAALEKKGWVKDDFCICLINRERQFPTGLDTGDIKIAIPHTDPDKVICEGMAVAVLKKSLDFGEMGSPGTKSLPVNIVFLLLIKKGKVKFYHKILNKIKNSDILLKLYQADSRQDVWQLLIKSLNT